MDSLLGVILVVQLPSQQPEVIFQYPRSEDESSKDQRLPSTADVRQILQQEKCFGIPRILLAKLMLPDEMLCNRPFYLELDAGHREVWFRHEQHSHIHFASFPCAVSDFVGIHTADGGPASPSRCGSRRPSVGASAEEHAEQPGVEHHVKPHEKVQRFNVVHVLDSRLARRRDGYASTLWQVSAHLSRALVSEETRSGYLSKEIRRLSTDQEALYQDEASCQDEAFYQDEDQLQVQHEQTTLDSLLVSMYEGIYRHGHKCLRVNGCTLCHLSVFPKHDAPPAPKGGQALVLTCEKEELEKELPADSSDIVRCVINAMGPYLSLEALMVRLALPLATIQRVAQHLIYWKKARVVDVYHDQTRLTVVPNLDYTELPKRFRKWQGQHKIKGRQPTLIEIVSAFSGGHTLQSIRESLNSGYDFDKLLEWLLAEGVLVQLGAFCHFVPANADPARGPPSPGDVPPQVRQKFCPDKLTESEVRLLGGRAQDLYQHFFLCRFVIDFARVHCRIDDYRFDQLAAKCLNPDDNSYSGPSVGCAKATSGLRQAAKLVHDNSDIFVAYTCRC